MLEKRGVNGELVHLSHQATFQVKHPDVGVMPSAFIPILRPGASVDKVGISMKGIQNTRVEFLGGEMLEG